MEDLAQKYEAWVIRKASLIKWLTYDELELYRQIRSPDKQIAEKACIDLIHYRIGQAWNGNRKAAAFLLHEFSDKALNFEPIDPWLSWYISKTLKASKGKKGRPKEETVFRDMDLYDSVLRKRVQGETFEIAVAETSQEKAASISTVRRAYKLFDRKLS